MEFFLKVIAASLLVFGFVLQPAFAQKKGAINSQGLSEKLLTADLGGGVKQDAVLSLRAGSRNQKFLAVLLPGTPGVLRPEVSGDQMTSSRLPGNPLIRARRLIATDQIALLAVDCRSDSGDECKKSYQSSPQREKDLNAVIELAKKEIPSISQVWLVGHSAGTMTAAFMGKFNQTAYAGIIYLATISDPYKKGSYRSLGDFDYGAIKIPQVFIHHKEDPCFATTYDSVEKIAKRFNLPLITVTGGSDFKGGPCEPYSQHGFRGTEGLVMRKVGELITTGQFVSGDLR
jgi:predicted alpha/beta hydrolase family esterase